MVTSLPKIDPDGFYSPKETWTILGIGKTALYRYDKNGLIAHEVRPENGRRVYSGKSIIRFHSGKTISSRGYR